MTVIKKIKDNSGSQFFPVTHERAVKDDNGTTLETKLQDINVAIDTTIPNHFTQVDSSIEQLLAANTELRITVNNLVGISNDSFMGIFQTVNDLPTMTSPGWALVGINLASLLLYTYTNITNAWTKYNDDTYDFTDYSGLVSQVAQIGSNLDELAEEVANNHPECNEAGEYHTDENLNVTYKYTSEGFDAAKLSSHFLSMISNGMAIGIAEMNEDGFAIVGENLNIAFLVDENGAHAANILEYENL